MITNRNTKCWKSNITDKRRKDGEVGDALFEVEKIVNTFQQEEAFVV